MRVYIAGPMTGYEDHNFPAFHRAEELLKSMGHEVVSPARLSEHIFETVVNPTWADFMRHDIPALLECDAIYILRGWARSKGANLEVQIARAFGFVFFQEGSGVGL